jgi:hypothetical protein
VQSSVLSWSVHVSSVSRCIPFLQSAVGMLLLLTLHALCSCAARHSLVMPTALTYLPCFLLLFAFPCLQAKQGVEEARLADEERRREELARKEAEAAQRK